MKLSEALRKGIAEHPMQTFNALYFVEDVKVDGHARIVRSCAMGAINVGLGLARLMPLTPGSTFYVVTTDPFPDEQIVTLRIVCECPAIPCYYESRGSNIASQILHLNDDHRWTREEIAKWLEHKERELG